MRTLHVTDTYVADMYEVAGTAVLPALDAVFADAIEATRRQPLQPSFLAGASLPVATRPRGTEIGELAAKPVGGHSGTLGVGAGPDCDVGGERRWLLFCGHTRYLRGSKPRACVHDHRR
jgi:hypothetical protein